MIARLFTEPEHRNALARLLIMVRPALFGAIARLNRHCAAVAHDLLNRKMHQWLIVGEFKGMIGPRFVHNDLRHGKHFATYKGGIIRQIAGFYLDNYHGHVHTWFDEWTHDIWVLRSTRLESRKVRCSITDDGSLRFMFELADGPVTCDIPHTREYDGTFEVAEYVHGDLHGTRISWYINGVMRRFAQYQHDAAHGPVITWSRRARIVRACYFVRGECQVHRNGAICERFAI